ncbi:DNA sulfur modification protein DndD [Arenimonas metalli]|uniref:DNA sulfur modification protein DndD n=1 Tax=Arenimonas metalli TaxID=948077 RepID=UPI000553E6BB|nr:DNA sulfur modification protein DndD [Arenimonas metalli]
MHLLSVTLRDWKAYESAKFEFPAPSRNKNVILIGGRNGFGKTTLFEALALGLFGRDGLRLVLRASAAADEPGRAQSFRDFIERALYGDAIKQGRSSCRIELQFEDEAGEPIWIERTWYFSDSGKLKSGDAGEQLRIFQGVARRVVGPSRSEQDPEGWYRDWISRTFLPTSLAGFFLFDGESAAVYAERDMGAQVREGIEGLLGLNWLRQLAKDLRSYAANKRTQVPKGVSSEAIAQLDASISSMEAELLSAEQKLTNLDIELRDSEAKRDALTRELSGYGTGTRAQLEELVKEQAEHQKQYELAQTKLHSIAEMDLPIALAGDSLRDRVTNRLQQERQRENWEAATSQRAERTSQVIEIFDQQLDDVTPSLTPSQEESVRQAVQRALERLWFPPPDGVAESYKHPHARGPLLQRVLDRLRDAKLVSSRTIAELLEAMGRNAAKLREVQAAIRATEVTAPQLEEKRVEIADLNKRISSHHESRGELTNLVRSRSDEIEQKNKERGRLTGKLDLSQRPAQLASRAEDVAEMIGELVQEAWPLQAQAIAQEMTRGIKSMAHRNDYLNRVEIDDEGSVELLSPDGVDLRQYDLSAGEKQIFTQALFSAIAAVSGRVFPLVIDTPLGRLDDNHRLNVLKHLASRKGQVFLISTDTEVVGPYLGAIKARVAKAYLIKNQTDGSIGRSWPEEGYFAGQEI